MKKLESKTIDMSIIAPEIIKVLAKHHLTSNMGKNVLQEVKDKYIDDSSVIKSQKYLKEHVYNEQ